MKRILTMMAACLAMAAGAAAQNPIFPNKAYNSDPQARVWTIDGKPALFVYGSKDENPSYYCSGKYDAFSTEDGHVRIDSSNRLAEIRDNDSAAWRDFNFKERPRKMIISVCPQAGGTIDVFSEYMYGGTVASFKIPEGGGKTFITLEAKVNSNLSGIKPIRMRFHGDADKNLFTINSFRFE